MTKSPKPERAFLFDLGGVLIDWDPRHLYRKLFDDEDEMEQFLAEVATLEWNVQHDAGRTWAEGVALLSAEYPEHTDLITAYWTRWDEMLGGAIDGTVAILGRLKADGQELHALTNWSVETFPIARERYEFLDWFETIVISGEEGLIKPDPAIYRVALDRIGRTARECIFIDDSEKNVTAAAQLGFDTIRFLDAHQLATELATRGF
jgi:2-haloacid dehalogenase